MQIPLDKKLRRLSYDSRPIKLLPVFVVSLFYEKMERLSI